MIALIDGDIVCYRAAASCEPTLHKAEREAKEVALARADDVIRRILHDTNSQQYRIFIGGSENFRYEIYPEYKGNRKDLAKPMWLQDVRESLVVNYNAIITDGIEADDAMGIEQTWEPDTIICSIDKDLLQVPGWHYNFVKQERIYTTPLDGLKRFYQQLIQGDQSDNIPGYDGKMRPKVPKFLQPKVDELWSLDNEQDMYDLVLAMYDNDAGRLLRNGRLLWILRKEGEQWQPPSDRQDELNS